MERDIESYLLHLPMYNPGENSVVNNYVHPKIIPGRSVQIHDYESRLREEVRDELESLVVQSVANWPTVDHSRLISDVLNVSPKDVDKTIEDLLDGGVIRQISEIKYQYEEPEQSRVDKIRGLGAMGIKGVTKIVSRI